MAHTYYHDPETEILYYFKRHNDLEKTVMNGTDERSGTDYCPRKQPQDVEETLDKKMNKTGELANSRESFRADHDETELLQGFYEMVSIHILGDAYMLECYKQK